VHITVVDVCSDEVVNEASDEAQREWIRAGGAVVGGRRIISVIGVGDWAMMCKLTKHTCNDTTTYAASRPSGNLMLLHYPPGL
jgi:hypothetical protein